jgi:hypothetical protein
MTNRLAFAHFCSAARRKGALALCLALCTLGLGLSGSASEPKFTTIDPTGSTYTTTTDINPAGAVTGYYQDAGGLYHGFLRAPDGTITTFQDPNAGTTPYDEGTWALGINPAGVIVGCYFDSSDVTHGFLLAPDLTTFTEIDVTAAGTGPNQGTYAEGINPAGTIVGAYIDTNTVYHGFVRDPHGAITPFDAPGACSSGASCSWYGTYPQSISPAGEITGYYLDAGGVYHGFVRDPWGRIMTFNARDAGTESGDGTQANSINLWGVITGYYIDANNVSHGFLRDPVGWITTFDAPAACSSGPSCSWGGTFPVSINAVGEITGYYFDANHASHGFLRDIFGRITPFDDPDAVTSPYLGTAAYSINPGGVITGSYYGEGYVVHGFLRTP